MHTYIHTYSIFFDLSITQEVVVIRGIEPAVFRQMLLFMYTDETPNIGEFADKLFSAADLVNLLLCSVQR